MQHPQRFILALLLGATFASGRLGASEPTVILDPASATFQVGSFTDKDNHKLPAGKAEVTDGRSGKAIQLSFVEGAGGGFITTRLRSTSDWNQSDGFSFWVKGDGSSHWGGFELIDRDDFSLRFGYCFPIKSSDWQKIVVPWRDVIPELAAPLLHADDGYAPANLGNLFIGKWFYWRDYPAESFTLGRFELQQKIELPPAPSAPPDGPIARIRSKLSRHQPVTIVTMGDSLSDKRHWSNHDVLWSELLAKDLKTNFGSDVKLVNPSIGGTTLTQNLILMPRWLKDAPSPDLVMVWFGGNDWDTGVRGPRFKAYLQLAVDRIRRLTQGKADVLLMTPCPGFERWETLRELEQAVRDVAGDKKTALVDIAAAFRQAGSPDAAMTKDYWASDKVHLGRTGHKLVKDSVLHALETKP